MHNNYQNRNKGSLLRVPSPSSRPEEIQPSMAILRRLLLLLLFLLSFPENQISDAQQSYVNNKQLDCNQNDTTTLGFVCNGVATSCTSYLTFRSTTTYNTAAKIARLLHADASQIAAANNISDVGPLPLDTLVVFPVNCSCSRSYYQHNASYILKEQGETYFTVANDTYQALTTCQSMIAQNPYSYRRLYPNLRLTVPLRCACPTTNQTAAGFKYLLTYLIRQRDTYDYIAGAFAGAGADVQSILDANELAPDGLIFFFTPLLVPLKVEPTKENINTSANSPPPPLPSPAPPTTPAAPSSGSGSRKWVFVGLGVGVAVLVMFSSMLVLWFFCYRHPRRHKSPLPPPKLAEEAGDAVKTLSNRSLSSAGIRSAVETLTVYKFEDLELATGCFAESNRINGSSVYRGSFKGDDGVVKIMKGNVSREIDTLRQINHSHIVRLSGFCLHEGFTYFVYEYAENGPLAEWLRPGGEGKNKDSPLSDKRLDWKQRLQVAYDVANALNYLHNFTNPPYIHKNLTSGNVLLDGSMRAKVANFGLARTFDADDQTAMTRHVVGTYGYMAPEYIESGLVTPKLDVFALGVVMLELLSGRESIANVSKYELGDQMSLPQIIEQVLGGEYVREKLREFMDPGLGEEYPLELAYSAAQLARCCVAHNLDGRPPVSEVFMALSKLLSSCLEWDPSHSHDTSLSLSD